MSNALRAVGKVFHKIVKVAKVVIPIALAAAAVVFTGGAALGVLPTFAGAIGSVVGGLGLSTGLATALSGAVVGAGFGSALGGITGGLSGGSILKGMQKGALVGAATGGIMPSAMPGMGNVIKAGALTSASDIASSAASGLANMGGINAVSSGLNAAAAGGASGIAPTALPGLFGATPLGAPTAASVSSLAAPVAPVAGGGLGGAAGGLASAATQGGINPLLASSLLNGVSSAFTPSESKQRAKANEQAAQEMGYYAYGGGDYNGKKTGGIMPGVYSTNPNAFGLSTYGTPPRPDPSSYYQPIPQRWQYNPTTNKVEEIPV